MALIGIRVPDLICSELKKIKVPGEKVDFKTYHITMFYLGDKVHPKEILKSALCSLSVLGSTDTFEVDLQTITSFPMNPEDGRPVICKIQSEKLLELREELAVSLDKDKIDYSKKFPEYKPHVTLSYDKSDNDFKDFEINKLSFKIDEIVFWGGDTYDEGLNIRIPLGGAEKTSKSLSLMSKVFQKIAGG